MAVPTRAVHSIARWFSSDTADEFSQFAHAVVNYSSEYGRPGSSSYTASNLAGPPRLLKRYGDFVEAFVLRTYGPWWETCPSATRPLKIRSEHFISQDFVELEYERPVIPTSISIFENYHPGAVVRILACNSNPTNDGLPGEVKWETLWSGAPQQTQVKEECRKFQPPLRKISYATKLIRLEFNSRDCGYYTELDAVQLRGERPSDSKSDKNREEGFSVAVTNRLLKQLSLTDRQVSVEEDREVFDKWGHFSWLPDEMMHNIFKYLDIVSLTKAAQACSLFLKYAYYPLAFTELDLQPFWTTVDNVALRGLTSRCVYLEHLSLSWTGAGGLITGKELCNFLENCGSKLITLRLACCQYINGQTMETIVKECPLLQELDLQSCSQLSSTDLLLVRKLRDLKRLNLYRLSIDKSVLSEIGRCCTQLKHLNLGSCALSEVSENHLISCFTKLRNLESLDLWRCALVTSKTLKALALNCVYLEELDIGWCPATRERLDDPDEIFKPWGNLKKLFFTCGRNLTDAVVNSLAKHCLKLEQFDILGSSSVTQAAVMNLLQKCKNLKFLDISFSFDISDDELNVWKKDFPNVCIKKSFQ